MLNPGIVCRETFGGSVFRRLVWLTGSRAPFLRDGLLEVPVYTPLDCDLVGLPRPSQDTPPELLAYAEGVLRVATIARRPLTMATFHDWIVGSGNRLVLLKSVLDAALGSGIEVSTVVAQENGKIIAR
jgi:hypothetical protein